MLSGLKQIKLQTFKYLDQPMIKSRGTSIKHLQSSIRKQLGRLTPKKTHSECLSPTYSRIHIEQDEPQRASFKSMSSHKQNTSASLSNKSPTLLRKTSLQTALKKHESSSKNGCQGKLIPLDKLKKKKSKKEQGFIKLKRGNTLQECFQNNAESYESIQLKFNTPKTKDQASNRYEQTIARYKAKIEQLQGIIETMMQC